MFSGMAGDVLVQERISVCCTERLLPQEMQKQNRCPLSQLSQGPGGSKILQGSAVHEVRRNKVRFSEVVDVKE